MANGYEIFQACTYLTKVLENQLGPLYLYEEKWRYPPPNHNFTTFLRSKKAISANFERKFLRV
jgi:hypothetical protein